MTRETSRNWRSAFRKGFTLFPKPDNRPNEWSPLPSGIVVACFITPVVAILLVGTMLNIDPESANIYGVLTFIFGTANILAIGDGCYIAGMRRIADQDLVYKDNDQKSRQRARPLFEPAEELDAFEDRRNKAVKERTDDDSSPNSYS